MIVDKFNILKIRLKMRKWKREIETQAKALSEELSKNPPVPWIQYNDWPVCCGDFAKYIGEWNKEEIERKSSNGKKYILDILCNLGKYRRIKGMI